MTDLATPSHIIKRDHTRAAFELSRIESAISRAGQATGELGGPEAQLLARQVSIRLGRRGEAPTSRKSKMRWRTS